MVHGYEEQNADLSGCGETEIRAFYEVMSMFIEGGGEFTEHEVTQERDINNGKIYSIEKSAYKNPE